MIYYHGYEIFKDNLGRWCYYFTKSPYSRDSDHKIAHASTLEEVKKLVDDEFFKNFEWLTTVEIEQKYGLPKGSVRRDIHRGKFKPGQEIYKKGRDWLINAEAAEKMYKKNPQE